MGDMLSHIMERRQLCAVSTLHQPRRHVNNATYLAKDSRYGPSQIDYILAASCRWASSAHKSRVKWGVSSHRWGRHYDHGLVSCDWQCRMKSHGHQVKHVDYLSLEKNDAAREIFDASGVTYECLPVRFGQRLCQFGPPDEVCLRCGTRDTSRQATQTTQKARSEPAHENVI